MTRVVMEERHGDLVIVDDEAWTLEEYAEVAATCPICRRRFLRLGEDGWPVGGRPGSCSKECRNELRRQNDQRHHRAERLRKSAA